jgi:hypothetical protein
MYGVIDDGINQRKLEDEAIEIPITRRELKGNWFSVTRDFKLSGDYKTAPFQVIIQEFECGPKDVKDVSGYKEHIQQSPEIDKLVYADVFKINEVK